MAIPVPTGVSVKVQGNEVTVSGPKGSLAWQVHPDIAVAVDGNQLQVTRRADLRNQRALHGLTRAVLNNMVTGVTNGFEKKLEVQGVGYRVELQGDGSLLLNLGFSHPVNVVPPAGIKFAVEARTKIITVSGVDKELVGRVTAEIRAWRPPEPYLGKGIRYVGEHVRHKAGKAGKVG